MKFSVIIPVFNRPDHVEKLLETLVIQSYKNFEVLIIESGSSIKSDCVAENFQDRLDISYHYKSNEGPGFSRNYGMERASGNFFIILDSDVLLPVHYLSEVHQKVIYNTWDAFGGPDRLHPKSSDFQVAVNYCMTSRFTTGGTRGKKNAIGKYFPRTFNMGFSRKVYEKIGGFSIPFLGEDIEFSHRVYQEGFKVGFIENAFVYHERKKNIEGFWKQLFFFGRARINLLQLVPSTFKMLHVLPLFFILYVVGVMSLGMFYSSVKPLICLPIYLYLCVICIDVLWKHKNLWIAVQAVFLVLTLMFAYALGMISEYFKLFIQHKKQTYHT